MGKLSAKERVELGRMLDKHQIKSIFYTEQGVLGGIYHIIRLSEDDDAYVEDSIKGDLL